MIAVGRELPRGTAAIAFVSAALCAVGCKSRDRPLFERIYGLDEIPKFELTLSAEARSALAASPREWVKGGFSYRDTRFDAVGIRLKGHRSLRRLGSSPSFKIQLDRFGKHDLAGQRTITLNNMVEDPSMMREVLAYRLYRALGVAAPSAGFAEVVVNGEHEGLYAVIESIDKRFLRSRFPDASGPIYEGEWGCDVTPDDVEGFDRDGGPKDREALAQFARVAAADATSLFGPKSPLDMPAFLRFLAVDMFVGNFDGYRHGHNYRLYFEPSRSKWYFMPWGLDRTFVKNLSIYDSQGYLAQRCFTDAGCRADYARTMREVIAEFRRLSLERGIDVITAVTASAAARDPDYSRKPSLTQRARTELREFFRDRPSEVERELRCLGPDGKELDRDGDGYACLDCDDANPAIHPGAAETCDGIDTDCNRLIDDAPACACQRVDAAGLPISLCDLPMTYANAERFCAARGERLVRIDDEPHARAIHMAARNLRRDKWWIDLDDRTAEGQFTVGGAAPTFTFWAKGEPNNAGCNQDCAVIDDNDDGRWADTHCLEHRPFVCGPIRP